MSGATAGKSPAANEWRAAIAPVPDGTPRPRWSVMIPTHNCAGYLRETLASVLVQDPGPDAMQIEVVDDCSTADDPEAVVRELGRGRVGFFRQPRNVRHVRNFETCLQRSRGHLVHLLHGDDLVRPGFYEALARPFEQDPEAGAAFCRYAVTDENGASLHEGPLLQDEPGRLDRWLERIAAGQLLQTPSMVVRRAVYERLGGFDRRLAWVEDWEMWVRIAAHYPVWYEPRTLAVYRIHASSSTGRLARTGEAVRDVQRAIAINREVLPPADADRLTREARRANGLGALRRARRMLSNGDLWAPLPNVREVLRMTREPLVLWRVLRLGAAIPAVAALRALTGRPLRWR